MPCGTDDDNHAAINLDLSSITAHQKGFRITDRRHSCVTIWKLFFNLDAMLGTVKCNITGCDIAYSIKEGFDLDLVLQMASNWGKARDEALKQLIADYPDARTNRELFRHLVQEYNLEDWHWNWVAKACATNSDSYTWFYLVADNKVQAVCIIFHPKPSRVDQTNIFYVDYLATAQWNRIRPKFQRQFGGFGPILLAHCVKYGRDVLKYRLGFSLHSLGGAESVYRKLGMQDFGVDLEKEGLRYFEAAPVVCEKMLENSYG